jgi:GNAT superfamily N-acetyltransferase
MISASESAAQFPVAIHNLQHHHAATSDTPAGLRPPPVPSSPIPLVVLDKTTGCPEPLALELCRMFKEQYGEQYPSGRFRDVKSIVESLARADCQSFLIQQGTPPTKTIAHAALLDRGDGIVEVGQILVASDYRGKGLGHQVTDTAIQHARNSTPSLLLAWAFTAHTHSQQIFERVGFQPVGAIVQDWPDVFGSGHREGAVVFADRQSVAAHSNQVVFAPRHLKEILSLAYAGYSCEREIVELDEDMASAALVTDDQRPSTLQVIASVDDSELATTGSVSVVHQDGATLLSTLSQVDELLQRKEVQHLSVCFDIRNYAQACLAHELGLRGFYYGLVQPLPRGEILTMQYFRASSSSARDAIQARSSATKHFIDLVFKSTPSNENPKN